MTADNMAKHLANKLQGLPPEVLEVALAFWEMLKARAAYEQVCERLTQKPGNTFHVERNTEG